MDPRQELTAIMQELSVRDIENYVSNCDCCLDLARRIVSNPDYEFDNAELSVFGDYVEDIPKLRQLCRLLPDGYKLKSDREWESITLCLSNPENCDFSKIEAEATGNYNGNHDFLSFIEMLDLATERRNYNEDKIQAIRDGRESTNYYKPGVYAMAEKYGLYSLVPVPSDRYSNDDTIEPGMDLAMPDPATPNPHNPRPHSSEPTPVDKPQKAKTRRVVSIKTDSKPKRFIAGQGRSLNNNTQLWQQDDTELKVLW
jgi:hypothetical protein